MIRFTYVCYKWQFLHLLTEKNDIRMHNRASVLRENPTSHSAHSWLPSLS